MSLSLEQIERQLLELRAGKNTSVLPYPPVEVQPAVTVDTLRELIKDVVANELALVKDSLAVNQPLVVEKPVIRDEINPKMGLLEAIGLGLTLEEQNWLSQPDKVQNINQHLPLFFQTEDGKLAVQSFIIYYKGVFNGTTS